MDLYRTVYVISQCINFGFIFKCVSLSLTLRSREGPTRHQGVPLRMGLPSPTAPSSVATLTRRYLCVKSAVGREQMPVTVETEPLPYGPSRSDGASGAGSVRHVRAQRA